MTRGGVPALVGVGACLLLLGGIAAAVTNGFVQGTPCAAYAVVPAVTVEVTGNVSAVESMKICSAGACSTVSRTDEYSTPSPQESTADVSPAPTGVADRVFTPVLVPGAEGRPKTWVFDLGPGDPSPVTLTVFSEMGRVLARETVAVSWHATDTEDGCHHGDVADPVTIRIP